MADEKKIRAANMGIKHPTYAKAWDQLEATLGILEDLRDRLCDRLYDSEMDEECWQEYYSICDMINFISAAQRNIFDNRNADYPSYRLLNEEEA
jgi:hypothetical protein